MSAQPPAAADVAIVGGGLTGLALARHLHAAGLDVQLFEARPRFGGRIAVLDTGDGGAVDLGPSWHWPGQPRIAALARALGLRVFAQHDTGHFVLEEAGGAVRLLDGISPMAGTLRVEGGMGALIAGLLAGLPATCCHAGHAVTGVAPDGRLTFRQGGECTARRVLLALPPRLAADLAGGPEGGVLDAAALRAARSVPTWMAGHAKLVAVYDRPFWRDAGLSGSAQSRLGPLVEIHDASGADGRPAALFGFVGVSAAQRAGNDAALVVAALAQLARLFGPQAAHPRLHALQDWAQEPFTAVPADRDPPLGHPVYGPVPALVWSGAGRVHIAASETAPEAGGLMEGALAAAEDMAARLLAGQAPEDLR